MKARLLLMGYLAAVAPVSQALPITIVVPGNGNEGPLILVEDGGSVLQPGQRWSRTKHTNRQALSVELSNAGPLLSAVEDNLPPSVTLVHQKLAANSWIDREVNKQGERCCEAGRDCHIVPAERVIQRRDGVMLPDHGNVEIPGNQIQVSQDGQYWVCIWGGKVRCFHAPHSGS